MTQAHTWRHTAVITSQFNPIFSGRVWTQSLFDCNYPPHPLGWSHQFVFTDFATYVASTGLMHTPRPCWQHIIVRDRWFCHNTKTCCLASKDAKMPLAARDPSYMKALSAFHYVFYLDASITVSRKAVSRLINLAASMPQSLLIREHEDMQSGGRTNRIMDGVPTMLR